MMTMGGLNTNSTYSLVLAAEGACSSLKRQPNMVRFHHNVCTLGRISPRRRYKLSSVFIQTPTSAALQNKSAEQSTALSVFSFVAPDDMLCAFPVFGRSSESIPSLRAPSRERPLSKGINASVDVGGLVLGIHSLFVSTSTCA